MQRKKTSRLRLLKVGLLRHLPGRIGLRYTRTHGKLQALDQFDAAVAASSGTVCIDLGANMGVYTRHLASRAARVIAFEPDPWTVERLRDNLHDLGNVEIVHAAAGTQDGTIALYRSPDFGTTPQASSQSSSILADKTNIDPTASVDVAEVDFVRFLTELDCDIGVIKIDIEGAEVALLERLLDAPVLSRISYVFVETHERGIPALAARTLALRRRVRNLRKPVFNMEWN